MAATMEVTREPCKTISARTSAHWLPNISFVRAYSPPNPRVVPGLVPALVPAVVPAVAPAHLRLFSLRPECRENATRYRQLPTNTSKL